MKRNYNYINFSLFLFSKSGRMEILKYDKETANDLIKRSQADISEVLNIVSDILKDVKENQDEAVKRYTAKFDKAELDDLQVSEDEIKEAYDNFWMKILLKRLKEHLQTLKNSIRLKFQKNGLWK